MKTILVIGGNGFLGSSLVRHLKEAFPKEKIISVSRHLPKETQEGVEYEIGDLLKKETIFSQLQKANIIINCAGLVSFKKKDRKKLYEANVQTAKNLVEMCNKIGSARISSGSSFLEHVFHISSCAAFGVQDGKFDVGTKPIFTEYHQKILPYSYSKFLAHQYFDSVNFSVSLISPPLIIDDIFLTFLRKKIQNFPFFIAPMGSNGIIHLDHLSKKIIQIIKENFLEVKLCNLASEKHVKEEYIFSHQTILFQELPEFFGFQKRTLVLSKIFQKPFVFLAGCLENIGFSIAAENVFFGFQKRDPVEKKL